MKAFLSYLCLLFVACFVACASEGSGKFDSKVEGVQEAVGKRAIDAVLRYIRAEGGDPLEWECSVDHRDNESYVWAWHILFPENKGSGRFTPGGYTIYVVSQDGRVMEELPSGRPKLSLKQFLFDPQAEQTSQIKALPAVSSQ